MQYISQQILAYVEPRREALQAWWDNFYEGFCDFCSDETKRVSGDRLSLFCPYIRACHALPSPTSYATALARGPPFLTRPTRCFASFACFYPVLNVLCYNYIKIPQEWKWRRQYHVEEQWWLSFFKGINLVALTLIYEAFVPCSLVLAVLVPMYFNVLMFDEWFKPWKSPITLGMLLAAPLKLVPWASFTLLL
jgi:hypothetical protein